MHCVLLDDDSVYCEELVKALEAEIPRLRGKIEVIPTEQDFRERLSNPERFSADFFILDVMVHWADPSEEILPAEETVEGGYFRAGIRCLQRIQEWKSDMPVIVQSALEPEKILSNVREKNLSEKKLHVVKKGSNLNDLLFAIKAIMNR